MNPKLLTATNTFSLSTSIYPIYPTESSSPINYKISSCSSEEEFDIDYLCPKCRNSRTANDRWCKYCESERLSEGWTNEILDEFIQYTQRIATKNQDYLVWIDYDKLKDVVYLARGGSSKVYYGVWIEGPAKTPVALKCLHNSESLIDELQAHYICRKGSVLRCYGVTQNKQTKEYMLVMKYANGGDLRRYLKQNNSILTWGQKLRMLEEIALGLEEIHSMKLLHRDLHSGNILQHTLPDGTMQTFVTDLGLCRPVNKTLTEERDVYGVMPYIAPEILRRTHDYSEASDIYSFGIIMWEILHGECPFKAISHNVNLAIRICDGFRPRIKKKSAPKWYISLMIKCWDVDHLRRPDIFEVRKIIANYFLCEVGKVKRLSQISSHSEAIFASQLRDVSGILKKDNNNESCHAYSEFESNFADSETELSHADSESEYSNYHSSSDEEQDEPDNKPEEEFDYVTRAFDGTLSVEELP